MNANTRKKVIGCVVIVLFGFLSVSCANISADLGVVRAANMPSEPSQVIVPVYVLVYGEPLIDLEAKVLKIMDYLERGTMYHNSGDRFLDFEIYKMATAKPIIAPKMIDSDLADYNAIYYDNGVDDLCSLAREGEIKQVWVWGNGVGGQMREAVDNGPVWQNTLWTNVPDCGVQLATLGNHFKMNVEYAVEAHIHRYEQFFTENFRYAFNKQTEIPYEIPGTQCRGSDPSDPWGWCVEDYIAGYAGLDEASEVGYTGGALNSDDIAQCGWAHYPPNITWAYRMVNGDASRYIYDYTGTVLSTCRNWRLDVDEKEIAEEINCTAWGCDKPGNNNQAEYFVWWMQNIPGLNNTNYDGQGNPMPNWWAALYTE